MLGKLAEIAASLLVIYMLIGTILATWLCVAAGEFSLDVFAIVVSAWPLLVFFWLMFVLAG